MMGSGIVQVVSISFLSVILLKVLTVMAASFQDLLDARALKRARTVKHKRAPKQSYQFVVISKNNQDTIAACLASIAKTKPMHPVIVLDNASSDNTLSIAKLFVKNSPKKSSFKISSKRTTTANAQLVKQIAKKCRGAVLIVLDGSMQVAPNFTKMLAKSTAKQPIISMLSFKLQAQQSWYLLGLLQSVQLNLTAISNKAFRGKLHHQSTMPTLGFAVPKSALKQIMAVSPSPLYISYTPIHSLSEYIAFTKSQNAVTTLPQRLLSLYQLVVLLAVSIYALWLALNFKSSDLLLFTVTVSLLWLLMGVWSDQSTNAKQKLVASYMSPTLLLFLPFVGVAKLVLQLRSLRTNV